MTAAKKLKVFPESQVDSTGQGTDFPGSSGGREHGKFRPGASPQLTKVAVCNDDGTLVTLTTNQILLEILVQQKAILMALAFLSQSEPFAPDDALRAAS